MSPDTAAWLATLRAEAASPDSLMAVTTGTVRSKPARAVIFQHEIVGMSDDELYAFVRARLAEQ